ncbi:transposase [Hoeflea alexandrii]
MSSAALLTGRRRRHPDMPFAEDAVWHGVSQTTGLVNSLLRLVDLDWAAPHVSTLSRRQRILSANNPYRGAHSITPPRKNAKPWSTVTAGVFARNEALRASKHLCGALWRPCSGYHRAAGPYLSLERPTRRSTAPSQSPWDQSPSIVKPNTYGHDCC